MLEKNVILTEKIDLENGGKRENRWNVTYSETVPHIWRAFFQITIHCKKVLGTSFDREFNALKECAIQMEKIDSENGAKKEKKDGMLHTHRQFLKFDQVFSRLKSRFNTSFDAEFNALPDYVIIIDKIDLENWEEKEKEDGMWHIQRQFLIFDEFLFKIKIHLKNRLTQWLDEEFNARKEYRILLQRIDLENGKKDRMLDILREFFIFCEFVVVCQIDTLETI